MKKLLTAILLFSFFLMAGCNNAGDDPKKNLLAFLEAMYRNDVPTIRKLATAESQQMINMMEMGLKNSGKNEPVEKFDPSVVTIGEAKIDGEKALIPITDKKSGETTNTVMKKEGGEWKVAFDMASIKEMAKDKMEQRGLNSDSLEIMLNKINIDSLPSSINGDTRMMDSVKAILKKMKKD